MHVQEHVPLRDLTTLKIGGTARYFVSVATVEELADAVSFARAQKLPLVILGGGSNVLVADGEIEAVVVKIDIRGIEWGYRGTDAEQEHARPPKPQRRRGTNTELVVAGAGENWDEIVAESVRRGLWGIENLSGIPGTIGAAPIQNIGAYGAEIKDVLEWVEVFDTTTGRTRKLPNADCCFAYRDSIFKHRDGQALLVARVALRLSKDGAPNLTYADLSRCFTQSMFSNSVRPRTIAKPALVAIRRAVLQIRGKKFPDLAQFGTAGSFFKNPIIPKEQYDELKEKYPDLPGFKLKVNSQKLMVKVPLAWILDNICGLKGFRKGNVALFERQPIVLVNLGGASAADMQTFAADILRQVKEKTGIDVEWEVQCIH
ncbi:MAG: UDP-N-acetylmuramate dehydrogenase [Patescibacteria group bacterium]